MSKLHLQSLIDLCDEYRAKIQELGEDALKKDFKKLFEDHPEIEAVRWAQYTPYFNDGDTCTFGVYDPEFKVRDTDSDIEDKDNDEDGDVHDPYDDDDEDEDEDDSSYGYGEGDWAFAHDARLAKINPEASKSIQEISDAILNAEDVMLTVFGDHAEITVRPDEINVEEYNHD